jgi:hypothetical protein
MAGTQIVSMQLIVFGMALLIPQLAMIAMIWRQDKDRPSKAVARRADQELGGRGGK